ncbi:anti-ECFsigma factor, ChrR [Flexistipes sinusarabici DSM 4947]|uniref:Anti-ECFsigma factor, ChrR n=1 Tax=Flexistipes sinusarabici (strain ATCC 49648 / DSM 4947 / MAS 10) TaxID=717231 RepID=F8E495_FLESM|nr:dimethylsulfonioproprionate lyase family protein [Flexistipes sinusarabici]AEI15522.1 anti-ECFsigma factor, ChrR [Flexistipes sinusarabici DSM 4947]
MQAQGTLLFLHALKRWYKIKSSGGTEEIKRHMVEVDNLLAKELPLDTVNVAINPSVKPVCKYLEIAIDNGMKHKTNYVVTHLQKFTSILHWQYGYGKLPEEMKENYAYSEILGPRGLIKSSDIAVGVVLLAPGALYHYHEHPDLTESYLNLSGYFSQNDQAVYPPESIVLNKPGKPHKITNDSSQPLLLAYVWTGSKEAISESRMVFD